MRGLRERGQGAGFLSPGNGSRGVTPENLLTTCMLYMSFSTYFVVKFIH